MLISRNRIEIFARTPKGELIEVYFSSNTTVIELKVQILDQKSIPTNKQKVFFKGEELQDTRLVADYPIKYHDIIDLSIT